MAAGVFSPSSSTGSSSSSGSNKGMSASTSTSAASVVELVQEKQNKLVQGEVDTTDTKARYLALLGRARPLLIASTRYLAYTSDIGEAFRPIINRRIVTGAYGISIAYVAGDIGYEGYKAHLDRQDRLKDLSGDKLQAATQASSAGMEIGLRVARRTVFQGLASIVLPAVTIHSAVKYSAPIFLKSSNPKIKGWGPTVVGLAIVPLLPVMFDHPVEHLTDKTFDYIEENWLGCTEEARGARRKHAEAGSNTPKGKSEL